VIPIERLIFSGLSFIYSLDLTTQGLYAEIAMIAYHFHWSKRECLNMSRKERRAWLIEIEKINKAIAKSSRAKKS